MKSQPQNTEDTEVGKVDSSVAVAEVGRSNHADFISIQKQFARDGRLLTFAAAAASLVAFIIYFRRGDLLLYGDAVAHINHARRLFDSLTPGFSQLGTVWLPLPHLLMSPLVASDWLWHTGIAGAVPNMIAFVLGVLGVFRVVSEASIAAGIPKRVTLAGGWLAAAIYGGNPNLLYLQSTAMNEPLYLALFIWSVVWLQRFAARMPRNSRASCAGRALIACGLCAAGAEMTRYEGWFAAACVGMAAALVAFRNRRAFTHKFGRVFGAFFIIVIAGPMFWLGYNYALHGNVLDFAIGPYSARAIEQRGAHGSGPLHPGDRDPEVAAAYYIRTAEADLGQNKQRYAMFWIAAAGAVVWLAFRRSPIVVLLWAPLPFYLYSVAYGSLPIFMPELPPWSYYNTRYGTAVLPAVAVFFAMAAALLAARLGPRALRAAMVLVAFLVVAQTYVSAYRMPHHRGWSFPGEPAAGPLTWREAKTNALTRERFEAQLAGALAELPKGARIMMYGGAHVGALQRAVIPLRDVVTEANYPFWQWALAAPAREADFVVAISGDPVTAAVAEHGERLSILATVVGDRDQGSAVIYRSALRGPQGLNRR